MRSIKTKPKTIDEYLELVKPDQRVVLEKLRKTIHTAAPGAIEYIGYSLAGFKFNGRPLVYFGAWENHCALYAASPAVQKKFQKELKGFEVSKGTIRFTPERPLPTALVRDLVKTRIAENNGANAARATSKGVKGPEASDSTDKAVQAFLLELKPPLKRVVETVRQIILGASAGIHESIKWNAPSFGTTEYFATLNLARTQDHVILILHTGAKPRKLKLRGRVADPTGLLKWLAGDRCLVEFDGMQDVEARRTALAAVIREWIKHV